MMDEERKYSANTSKEHLKKYGQFFTPERIARFMTNWACENALSVLDPAVGNSVFFRTLNGERRKTCKLFGYEIDSKILDYFGNPFNAEIENEDYFSSPWDTKYDAIVCNPPYNRFQALGNRSEILVDLYNHTDIRFSGYTNSYILFLAKSIYQLSSSGRLAYLIPSEFLNSKYGVEIKTLLVKQRLLRAIINFSNDSELYENATTTNCILLLDKGRKDKALFINLKTLDEIANLPMSLESPISIEVPFEKLDPQKKWRELLNQETTQQYRNMIKVSLVCNVSRGIATGANDFFCFSMSKARKNNIPEDCLLPCICKSSDVRVMVFSDEDFIQLREQDKTVYVLNADCGDEERIQDYLRWGLDAKINLKYLPSCRKPWYSMENKKASPIWVTTASRGRMKFVRNTTQVRNLTTFHSVFINPRFNDFTDVIFCYFITPVGQEILRKNRKALGNGLDKFQPNDLNSAEMLDITRISNNDLARIEEIYKEMNYRDCENAIKELNSIFLPYIS